MAAGVEAIPESIVQVVADGSQHLISVSDGHRQAIPAPFVVWMRYTGDDDGRPQYDAKMCRPKRDMITDKHGLNDLSILMDWDMISDHLNPKYERAVNSVLEQLFKH
jgi:hypothetical protein